MAVTGSVKAFRGPTRFTRRSTIAGGGRASIDPSVSVVIPTLDEAANLPHVLPHLDQGHEVVIVDGGSTDATIDVALRLRPDAVIVHQTGRGKGNALRCGFATATGDIIVMLDADGSALPSEIDRFVEALLDGADFAKGSRNLRGGGSADISRLRHAGNRALSRMVNALFGTAYTDLCYGYNAFWSRCLPDLAFDCAGFEVETMLNLRARRAGLSVVEVPSFEARRIHGETHLKTFRDGWRVLRTIVRERLRPSGPATQADSPAVPRRAETPALESSIV